MRTPLRSLALFLCGLLLAATFLVADPAAAPAEAVSRRAPTVSAHQRKAAVRTYRKKTYRKRSYRRSSYRRTYRSARRTPRAPAVAVAPTPELWAALRQCEAGGRYDINTGNGYYGAYQFKLSTWQGLGYPGYPHQAPPQMQDEAAQKLQARSGWGQWPACSRRIGAR